MDLSLLITIHIGLFLRVYQLALLLLCGTLVFMDLRSTLYARYKRGPIGRLARGYLCGVGPTAPFHRPPLVFCTVYFIRTIFGSSPLYSAQQDIVDKTADDSEIL